MIEIIIRADSAPEARSEMERLLGTPATIQGMDGPTTSVSRTAPAAASEMERLLGTPAAPEPDAPAPRRKRRTKAEIEAEKAAEAEKAEIEAEKAEDVEDDEPDTAGEDLFDGDESAAEADDMIEGYAVTDEGLVAAMQAYVAKFDMAAAQRNAKTLFGGYTKRSEVVAAGEAALAKAIANFAKAVRTGKEV